MRITSPNISTNPQLDSISTPSAPTMALGIGSEPVDNSSDYKSVSTPSVTVSLSPIGLQKSKQANPNADIEQSGLPDKAQKLLKMIREIQKQIDEKNEELRVLMANQTLSDEVKRTRAGTLQSTIATLSSSLMTASTSLDNLTKNGTLTASQGQQAAQLTLR